MGFYPYQLRVEFDEPVEVGVHSGRVLVAVFDDITCRKLTIRPVLANNDSCGVRNEQEQVTLIEWMQWSAGETLTYPFSLPVGDLLGRKPGIITQVHRNNSTFPDPEQTWLVVEREPPAEVRLSKDLEQKFKQRARDHVFKMFIVSGIVAGGCFLVVAIIARMVWVALISGLLISLPTFFLFANYSYLSCPKCGNNLKMHLWWNETVTYGCAECGYHHDTGMIVLEFEIGGDRGW